MLEGFIGPPLPPGPSKKSARMEWGHSRHLGSANLQLLQQADSLACSLLQQSPSSVTSFGAKRSKSQSKVPYSQTIQQLKSFAVAVPRDCVITGSKNVLGYTLGASHPAPQHAAHRKQQRARAPVTVKARCPVKSTSPLAWRSHQAQKEST